MTSILWSNVLVLLGIYREIRAKLVAKEATGFLFE